MAGTVVLAMLVLSSCSSHDTFADKAITASELGDVWVSNVQHRDIADVGAGEAAEQAGITYDPARCGPLWVAAANADRGKRRIIVAFRSGDGEDYEASITQGTAGLARLNDQYSDDCATQTHRAGDGQLTRYETTTVFSTFGLGNTPSAVYLQKEQSASPQGEYGDDGFVGLMGLAVVGDVTVQVKTFQAFQTANPVPPNRYNFDKVFLDAVKAAR